jgi:hypothetical protein
LRALCAILAQNRCEFAYERKRRRAFGPRPGRRARKRPEGHRSLRPGALAPVHRRSGGGDRADAGRRAPLPDHADPPRLHAPREQAVFADAGGAAPRPVLFALGAFAAHRPAAAVPPGVFAGRGGVGGRAGPRPAGVRGGGERGTLVSATLQPGTRVPAWCTANGRMLLASLPQAEIERFLAQAEPEPITPHTIVDKERLALEIARARAQGYAWSTRSWNWACARSRCRSRTSAARWWRP